MASSGNLRERFLRWIDDIPGDSHDSFECDPFDFRQRHSDTGTPRPPPAWGGSDAQPGRALDEGEQTEADSCLPYGEKRGRFGTNEELRDIGDESEYGLATASHLVPQRRVWSFNLFPVAQSTRKTHAAGPRLHYCWHNHLPIFAVARPDPQRQPASDRWVIELYQVGAGKSNGIPSAEGFNDSLDAVGADATSHGTSARKASVFRLHLGENKGSVRSIAFQPHGGTNLLIGCTHSIWFAQFSLVEGDTLAGSNDDTPAGGFSVALVWLSCVFHLPPLKSTAQKIKRRICGLGARASPNYLQSLSWSPDGGRFAACFSGEECVRVWEAGLLMARNRVGAQPPHAVVSVPLCKNGASLVRWSPTGAYLFAAHATGKLATVWDTKSWHFHQWSADCRQALWASTSVGPASVGRQVLFTVERPGLADSESDVAMEPFSIVKAVVFSIEEPLCDHEQHSLHLSGDGLLDIREEVAKALLAEDFPAPADEVGDDIADWSRRAPARGVCVLFSNVHVADVVPHSRLQLKDEDGLAGSITSEKLAFRYSTLQSHQMQHG